MRKSMLPIRTSIVIMTVVLISTSLLTGLLFPGMAEASIGSMMKNLKNDMGSWFDVLIYACYGGGIGSTMLGIANGIKKSKGEQVTMGSVLGYGLGGPALCMLGYIVNNIAESLGGSANQMNRLPGGL